MNNPTQKYQIAFLISLLILASGGFCFSQHANHQSLSSQITETPKTLTLSAKFAIVTGHISLWSNDGSSVNGSEPETSVLIKVKNGRFQANLGESPMEPIFADLIKMYPNSTIKTWIDNGDGFKSYPDRPFSSNDTFSLVDLKFEPKQTGIIHPTQTRIKPAPMLIANATIPEEEIERKEREKEQGESSENPDERRKQRFMQRAGADGRIPRNALLNAKNHLDNWPPADDAGIWNWTWLGPGNIGGRIRAIIIHPDSTDKMWIGAASGGIWKTTNGGASWSVVNDFLPSLAITSFAMNPNDYEVMYAASGEGFGNSWPDLPGAGIFKSTDGGDHWYQLPETNVDSFNWVTRLAQHPSNSNILYATARVGTIDHWEGKVYKSVDGGEHWTTLLTTPNGAYDIKLQPGNPSTIFVGTAKGFYRSINGGTNWVEMSTGAADKLPDNTARCEIGVSRSYPQRVYVSLERQGGQIWRSDDSGNTWTLRNTGTNYFVGGSNQGGYDNTIWVNPTNSNYVVVGGIDLWRDASGGGTLLTKISRWEDYHNGGLANSAHADQHIIIEHPDFDSVNNTTVFFGNDGGIQKTDNINTVSENAGWINLANNLGITQFYGGSASLDASVIIGGAQDNSYMIYKSANGAQSWQQPHTGDGGFCAVNFRDPDTLFTETQYLQIKISFDGGETWYKGTRGLLDTTICAPFIAPFCMDPKDPNTLVAGGCSIWRYDVFMLEWYRIKNPLINNDYCSAIDIGQGTPSRIWVGYKSGEVAFTDNQGGNWAKVDDNGATPLPDRWITDIAANPDNQDEIFVTFAGYNDDNVWYTTNCGQTWSRATGNAPFDLPAVQVNTVRYHPANSNWIYIGTDLGVFASENKGQTWSTTPRYPNSEGPVNVEVDELFWAGDELIAATHGRGMFKCRPLVNIYVNINSPDGGDGTWAKPYNTVQAAINAAGNGTNIYIFQGTYNESPLLLSKRGYILQYNGNVIIE
jgi:photosystem II stability/assembly factor-like uncharacterized protein